MEALKRSAPVPIAIEKMSADMDGFFSPDDQRIAVREGMSEVQTVSAAVHEIAHSKLHNYEKVQEQTAAGDETAAPVKKKDRGTEEVEAESISYAVCAYYGVATGENSFGYIATWSENKELPELRASLETINKTASGLITDIDRNYAEIMKERGLDKVEPELDAAAPEVENSADEPTEGLFLLDGKTYLHLQQCEGGYDYSLYDKESMKLLDGGAYEDNDLPDRPARALTVARVEISALHELTPEKVEKVPLDVLEQLQAANEVSAPYFEYKLHANPRSTCEQDAAFIQAYEHKDGNLYPADIIGIGAYADFIPLTNRLNEDKVSPNEAVKITDEYAYTPPAPEMERGVEEVPAATAPDNGYLPDPAMTVEAMNAYGYTDADMLPLSRERAIELFQKDLTVYMLYDDNTEAMAFDTDEIITFNGIFGISRGEWENYRESAAMPEVGAFSIYQLRPGEENRDYSFRSYSELEENHLAIDRNRYELKYADVLPVAGDNMEQLNEIYRRFNIERPADFTGHSLSVSDIVVIRRPDDISCHYVDSFGFKEVPTFLKPENYLKNAEMAMEDDYGMIDGIVNNGPKQPTVAELEQQAKSGTPISLMDLAAAVHRERDSGRKEKKPSVLEQLKSYQDKEKTNTAPKKSAEREL